LKLNKRIGFLALVFAIIVVLGIVGVEATSKPAFCQSCHLMKNDYATWQISSHKDVDCLACHKDPGFTGLVKVKVNGLRQLYLTATGYEGTPKAEVPNSRCLACHEKKMNDSPLTGITFSHQTHLSQGKLNCTSCHARVVHSEKPVKITMQECINCHQKEGGKGPVNSCTSCHQDQKTIIPESHKQQNWLISHKNEDLNTCARCHTVTGDKSFCQSCHQTKLPHAPEFIKNHGTQVGTINCTTCHPQIGKTLAGQKAVSCSSCHTVELPHPANWLKVHGESSKKYDCTTCHLKQNAVNAGKSYAAANFCSSCHQKNNPHSQSFIKTHGNYAKSSGANCSTCHKTSFCSNCHTKKDPHPENWLIAHKNQAIKTNNNCSVCHNKTVFCSKCHN